MLVRLLPLFLLVACPDPTQSGGNAGGGAPIPAGAPMPGGVPGGGMPGAGGGPGGAGGGAGLRPTSSFDVEAGQGVKVAGTVSYEGTKTGQYRVDFLRQNPGSFPELLHSLTLEKPGAWEVEAPKNAGEVAVVGFLDADGNGPSDGEPAGLLDPALKIADQPIAGVNLVLTDNPDLKDLKPPGAGKSGAGAPGVLPTGGTEPPPGGAPPPPGGALPPPGLAPPVDPAAPAAPAGN